MNGPLDAVEAFLRRYVAYPDEHSRVAHTLWIAHTWHMDRWDSTPRIAFLSPEPGSGKSRALEVTAPLVPRPVHAVNTTPAYLFRKVSDPGGAPTILYDEIDTVFGPKAKDNEDIRGMLNAGHRKGAVAGRCVVRGKTIETEELPAYAAVAMAGLGDLPDTIATRSVVVRMRRRAPGERVEPWRARTGEAEAEPVRLGLEVWAASLPSPVVWPVMPEGVEDRDADVWEALVVVADLAGGDWPNRARDAARNLVAKTRQRPPSLSLQLLADLRRIFATSKAEAISTTDALALLCNLEESRWADLYGKPLDALGLSNRLRKYDIAPRQIRIGGVKTRGYERGSFLDAWSRYLVPDNPGTPGTPGAPGTDAVPARYNELTGQGQGVPGAPGVPGSDGDRCPLCSKPTDGVGTPECWQWHSATAVSEVQDSLALGGVQ